MIDNPLIDEARKAGQAYIDSFKGDRKAMIEDLRKREKQHAERVVRLVPKSPRKRTA